MLRAFDPGRNVPHNLQTCKSFSIVPLQKGHSFICTSHRIGDGSRISVAGLYGKEKEAGFLRGHQTEPSIKRSLMNDHSVFASDEISSISASNSCHMVSFLISQLCPQKEKTPTFSFAVLNLGQKSEDRK
jgi:hypothetical protein